MPVAPYGTWKSPITAALAVENLVRPSFPTVAGTGAYWVESRPSEAGRFVLCHSGPGGEPTDVLPPDVSVRTLAHEYGGRCHAVHGSSVYFVNFADQRVYRLDEGAAPVAITPEPPAPRAWRYADLSVTPDGRHVVCVRERHEEGEVVNDVAAFPVDGSSEPIQLAGGHDFYLAPRLDASGRRLAFVGWDHPNMPWDGTWLYEAEMDENLAISNVRTVAGGLDESVAEPSYSPAGKLHYVSDRTSWWNLYEDDGGSGVALAPVEGEFTLPAWQFGISSHGFRPDGSIVARWRAGGVDHIGTVAGGAVEEIETPYTVVSSLAVAGDRLLVLAASGTLVNQVAWVSLPSGEVEVVRTARPASVDPSYLSVPEAIEPVSESGVSTRALYYKPQNPDFEAPEGDLPPLIVSSHGGPTSASTPTLDYEVQFWTTRGFAVVAVNYGGSTGYGREYRDRLRGEWGVVDLDDCVLTAQWLAAQGLADPQRLMVHGGSAGGYTTLCGATFRDVFAAGASYFGVGDLGALARDTHKFEARYLESLVGPWPEAEALYEERSPLFHTDQLRTPLILFQGLEDKVVPPAQAEAMAAALRAKGVPFAYIPYEGEQHGFRQAANMIRTIEAELYFYGRVLGFEPADAIDPVTIENGEALAEVVDV
jgi:dipeptidyl aminopeptidase/acylaminoacyl peptidase